MLDSGVYEECSDFCLTSELEEDVSLRIDEDDDVDDKDHHRGKLTTTTTATAATAAATTNTNYNDIIKNIHKYKVNSETDLVSNWMSRAETTLRQVRDSYNDLRIREESSAVGRSDLGPLTGRFDKACRLSKSYYFDSTSSGAMKDLFAYASFKKSSLNNLDLDCHGIEGNDYDDEEKRQYSINSRRKDDFVDSLKKLFNLQLAKYGSASGSLCSTTSSDYSSWSNDRSGRDDSADESGEILEFDEGTNSASNSSIGLQSAFIIGGESDNESFLGKGTSSFLDSKDRETQEFTKTTQSFLDCPEKSELNNTLNSNISKDNDDKSKLGIDTTEKKMQLDIEETLPKLNWEFLEEQLEKAIKREKSASSQLRDEIIRKMAVEANQDDDNDDEYNTNSIFRMSTDSYDSFDIFNNNFISENFTTTPTRSTNAATAVAAATITTTTRSTTAATATAAATKANTSTGTSSTPIGDVNNATAAVSVSASTTAAVVAISSATVAAEADIKQSAIYRRSLRKSRHLGFSSSGNQLQVCFVNEMSLDDDDTTMTATTTAAATTAADSCQLRQQHYLCHAPPSEYSTICSGLYSGDDCDSKSVGTTSQITRASIESSKSSLHPLPALFVPPKTPSVDGEEHFFTKQARLQAEARLALAQVRPMSYMQFLLEKQARKESCPFIKYNIPGLQKWEDVRCMDAQKTRGLNSTHLQIIINHFLSEITCLNEELMQLLVERDELCIVQDSMLVDIEDFTRRAEEWEYRKLMRSTSAFVPSSSSSSSLLLPSSSSYAVSSISRR